ncbi:MAG: hypothetical protein ABSF52_19360 [Syntrophobacteraceae bacterium]
MISAQVVNCKRIMLPVLTFIFILLASSASAQSKGTAQYDINVSKGTATQVFKNTTIINPTGLMISAMDIIGKNKTVIARLLMMGNSMSFGNDQRPIKGAGTIVGGRGKKFSILILPQGEHAPGEIQVNNVQAREITLKMERNMLTCCGGIPVGSGKIPDLGTGKLPKDSLLLKTGGIFWDDDGVTTSISELDPIIICNGKKVKITSDVKNPTVKDGLLFIDTELGKLTLKINYGGYGTPEGATDFLFTTDKKQLP